MPNHLLYRIKTYPLLLQSLFCALIFAWITQSFISKGTLIDIDARILQFLFSIRDPISASFFTVITFFASATVGVFIMLVITALFTRKKQFKTGSLFMFGFLCANATTYLLKLFFERARPELLYQAVTETTFALPSGHATTSAFVFGLLGYLALLRYKSKHANVYTIGLVLLGVLLIDFSRLYLGVHFLSDVLLGNVIGFFFLFVTISVHKWLLRQH